MEDMAEMARQELQSRAESFDDPIATQTDWSPLKRDGFNFCKHRLKKKDFHQMVFRPTVGYRLFCGIFLAVGVGVPIADLSNWPSFSANKDDWILPIFGLVFAGIGGGMMFFALSPIVFDKRRRYFWRGRSRPEQVENLDKSKKVVKLDSIHALQIISEWVTSSSRNGGSRSYRSYELNLVLKDSRRINVSNHGKGQKLLEDAQVLSNWLGVPSWDGTY